MPIFKLKNRKVVPCEDFIEWAEWNQDPSNSRVAEHSVGEFWVSTIFIGASENVLFETLVAVGKDLEGEVTHMRRYSTWDDAEAGHRSMVKELQELNGQAEHSTQQILHKIAQQ